MRDYGIVRVRFWAWAKDRELSPAAREMALYALTCPHGTACGCFRLPIAYIADDLGTVAETVRQTLSELSRIGFLRHDEKSGWCWIVGYLDHNPIANPNVGKSLVEFLGSIPRNLPFFQEFVASLKLHSNRFPNGFVDGLANGIGNGSANGMPNQNQEQEQRQEQDQGGASADPDQADDVRRAYEAFNAAATKHGWSKPRKLDDALRKLIGARLKEEGIENFLAALAKAEASRFVREEMNGWSLRWMVKAANFNKLIEDHYADRGAQRTGRPVSRMQVMANVVERLKAEEEGHA